MENSGREDLALVVWKKENTATSKFACKLIYSD